MHVRATLPTFAAAHAPDRMENDFLRSLYERHQTGAPPPSPARIGRFLDGLLGALFPDFHHRTFPSFDAFERYMGQLRDTLGAIVAQTPTSAASGSPALSDRFFDALPEVRALIAEDATAMCEGDPAARSVTEVVRSYPGFRAIAAHRVAHALHRLGVELVPRTIAERAHSTTGIDIHPGATIGRHFCIDHGTGVVIGETSVIGDHVKIYQGVTLGGLSVRKEDASTKRHPTVEDHVVIYAGATILGGDTVVGHHSVIGGNVWLTRSVPPHTKVYYKASLTDREGHTDTIEFK